MWVWALGRRARVALSACAAVAISAVASVAAAAVGDLTFGGCVGDLPACAPTSPPGALDYAYGVAISPDGRQLYVTGFYGADDVSHFALDRSGSLTFKGCVGDQPGCTGTSPAGALDSAGGVAVSPDGRQLYVAAWFGNDVSHFALDSSGSLMFKGCVGDRPGCAPTSPAGALDSAIGVAVSPDGRQLYLASGNDVSHLTLDSSGNPTFKGCVGYLAGCTATNPAGALDSAIGVALSPDGRQLYLASGNDVSHLTLDSSGNPTFRGCVGYLAGCTSTSPAGALDSARGVAVSPDGRQLYLASGNDVSHLTLDSSGNPTFKGCVGHLAGCTATSPAGALDSARAVAVSPSGRQLYLASGNDVSHLTLDSSGNPTFKGCVGRLSGCTATSPAKALDGAEGVAISPDGRLLYAAAGSGNDVSRLMIAQPTLAVSLAGSGAGTVTGSGISCPGTCSRSYRDGAKLTLTAKPAPGSAFAGWSGACTGTRACELAMRRDHAVTATFELLPLARITSVKIDRKHHQARFTFKAIGHARGFQCLLIKLRQSHNQKRSSLARPRFSRCKSPKTYQHLRSGRYRFEVRGLSRTGAGPIANRRFTI